MIDYKLIAVSKLLDAGYNIFLPVSSRYLDYDYLIESNKQFYITIVLPVHLINNTPVAKLVFGKPPRLRSNDIHTVCCVREETKQVWLIPFSDIQDCTSVSLKKRYDQYLLDEEVFCINKSKSVLTEVAIDVANRIKETENDT